MKLKLSTVSRLLLLLAGIGLIAVLFTPIWRIDLDAPQYPEGLSLQIHATGLKGNVDIINGLNHYIGMKTLHNEDFVEFRILPYAIIFFAGLFVVSALFNRRWMLHTSFVLFVLFGVLAMYDFWQWEYDYGHNLNPDAAIKVPGMAYQPPLIGFKQLLNFGAYSVPHTGGWIFIGAGAVLLVAVILEWRRNRIGSKRYTVISPVLLLPVIVAFFLSSCNVAPEAIVAGKDNCYFCKMTITDVRYASEILSTKGKSFKFDDVHCLQAFTKSNMIEKELVKDIYVSDFTGSHDLLNVKQALFIKGGSIHSPMNGDVIAFSHPDSLKNAAARFGAAAISWQQLSQ